MKKKLKSFLCGRDKESPEYFITSGESGEKFNQGCKKLWLTDYDFEAFFGLKLKPGKQVKVRLVVEK